MCSTARRASAGSGPGSWRPASARDTHTSTIGGNSPSSHEHRSHRCLSNTCLHRRGRPKERDARRSRRLCQDRGLRHDATALSRLTSARGHPGTTPTRAYVPRPSWGNKQWAPLYGRPLAQRSCKRMLGMYTPQGCQGGPGKEERGCNSSCRMKSSEQPPRRIVQHPPSLDGAGQKQRPHRIILPPARICAENYPPAHATPRPPR